MNIKTGKYMAFSENGELPMVFICEGNGTYTNFHTGECGFINKETEEPMKEPDSEQAEKIRRINQQAEQIFIRQRNKIETYCKERDLDASAQEQFGLGFSADLSKEGFSKSDLLLAGLAKEDENGFRMVFRNRMMFPIHSPSGKIIAFGGRIMEKRDNMAKYLNTGETEVFRKRDNLYMYHIAKDAPCRSFILCEGYMDVIAMHRAGFTNTVASLGTSLTKEQVRLLKKKPHIYILYDSDDAGIKAAKRAILMLKGLEVKVVRLGTAKDPDEFLKGENGREEMVQKFREALPAKDFLRETYRTGDDPEIIKYLLM